MPSPTPNGPTLNDLMYSGYNQSGYEQVTTVIPSDYIAVSDSMRFLTENVVLNFVGYTYTVDTADFLNTAENVQVSEGVTGPNLFSINISNSVTTSENTALTVA